MSVLLELSGQPGFIAAGEYSYRGDRFSFKGHLTDDMARMASIMCRATTMSEHMQAGMLEKFCPECGILPPKGWVVRGPNFTVANMANVFCFLDNSQSSINDVMAVMERYLGDASDELI
jgi:roadblock/LC7 domain-containing protein